MRKYGVFSTVWLCTVLLAGLYGMLHDQVTATIAPEYYTKLKFKQFGIPAGLSFRTGVSLVGFYATWWMGVGTGFVLGLTGLVFPDHKSMAAGIRKALGLLLSIVMLAGLAGYVYGKYYLVFHEPDWWFPAQLQDKKNYIIVGAIHNAGYAGGGAGLLICCAYLVLNGLKARAPVKQ